MIKTHPKITIANPKEKVNEPLQADERFDRMGNKKDGESMYTKKDYIAVFDSGMGGISVLRQLRKLRPHGWLHGTDLG